MRGALTLGEFKTAGGFRPNDAKGGATMLYTTDFYLDEFEFWGAAKARMNHATDEQKALIAERLEAFYDDRDYTPTETEINDFVWFECDDIFYPEEDE